MKECTLKLWNLGWDIAIFVENGNVIKLSIVTSEVWDTDRERWEESLMA